jgi:hypothetical protein
LPCSDTSAVRVTVRCSSQRNASASASVLGIGNGPAALQRASGAWPVSEWIWRW